MAERLLSQNNMSYERDTLDIYGRFEIGAAGAVTAGTVKGGGIVGVTKEATAGRYTIELERPFSRLLFANVSFVGASASGVFATQILETPANLQADVTGDGKYVVQFYDAAGSAVNATSGTQVLIRAVVRKTSVGPWDN